MAQKTTTKAKRTREAMSLEDVAIVLVVDKACVGDVLAGLLGQAAAPGGAFGIANVPPAGAQDALSAMGVNNPPTSAEEQAGQLLKRTAYYDDVKRAKG